MLLRARHPLWTMPDVLITPHAAGHGPYLDDRRLGILLDNCRRFATGQPLRNVVDKEPRKDTMPARARRDRLEAAGAYAGAAIRTGAMSLDTARITSPSSPKLGAPLAPGLRRAQ